MTKRAVLMVSSNPISPERTEDFNSWYVDVHIPQILEKVPGVVAARRYRLHEASPAQPGHRYLAVYEIEAEDPTDVLAELGRGMATGVLDASDALDMSIPPTMVLYDQL